MEDAIPVSLDELSRQTIEKMIGIIGLPAAALALCRAAQEATESTHDQLFSTDGGYAQEIAALFRNDERFNVKFSKGENGLKIDIFANDTATQDEIDVYLGKMKAIYEKYNKISPSGVVKMNTTITKEKRPIED